MAQWYTKVKRYDGSESVLQGFETKEEARQLANELNEQYQTHTYYAEEHIPAKAIGFGLAMHEALEYIYSTRKS